MCAKSGGYFDRGGSLSRSGWAMPAADDLRVTSGAGHRPGAVGCARRPARTRLRGGLTVSYSKDIGEVSARYQPVGVVPSVTYSSGTHIRFTAPGATTSGQYGLFEWNMAETRGGADPHFHKTFSESFYIMEGTVRLFNGDAWIDAAKGDVLYVPQGGIQAFSNESGAPARMLILFAPG